MSLVLFFCGCTKEIDILEFSDDFSHYEPELRIEALMLPSDNTAIVRIDKSVLITDTELYNCIDEDGDWNPEFDDLGSDGVIGDPTDDDEDCEILSNENSTCYTEPSLGENNGVPDCGEPHVDETDEIITQLHIDDNCDDGECCSVKMTNSSDDVCNFKYA